MNYAYHFFLNHTLVHIYKGELYLRNQCGESLVIKSGNTAFVGRDSHLQLYCEEDMDDACSMSFLEFPLSFLCEFYHTLDKNSLDAHLDTLSALHLLPLRPEIESLFQSLIPYIKSGEEISDRILQLKRLEGVYSLLNINKQYAAILFDFTGKCRLNIYDLLKPQTTDKIVWKEIQHELISKVN